MSITFKTPQELLKDIAARFKARRLALNLTQAELAARSGVSWGSVKRFERHGLIALDALLMIALVLDCLGDFEQLAARNSRTPVARTLDEILAAQAQKPRRRASGARGRRR